MPGLSRAPRGCGDPFHRRPLAHPKVDVQGNVNDELVWELRGLQAADLITDEDAAQAGVSNAGLSTPDAKAALMKAAAS